MRHHGREKGLLKDEWGNWRRDRMLFAAGLIFATGFLATCHISNNLEYSIGQRVGVINKVSEKGLIWKTKEGQLSLEGRTSTGEQTGAGVWNFSLDNQARNGENVDSLYVLIQKYMEEGQRVKITYEQNPFPYPWRASTSYMVQSVEPLPLKKDSN